ncbi:MAG TPA: glycosyltransferase family 2 protein [Thermoanaerobaculia bacterium]|nr:glycosyltransferase family 2 protein [Thermoanaerobaculia bacterium]
MISVVIPVHNEQEVFPLLLQRLRAAAATWNEDYEFVFVDDGSTDRTLALMMDAARDDTRVRIVKLSRNFGHQAAISAGLEQARGRVVAVMDGDLQDPPEQLARFLAKWREGYEVVYGIRRGRKEGLLLRGAYAMFYRALHVVSDIDIPVDSGDFGIMDRKVVDALRFQFPEQIRFVRGLRAYAGFRQIGLEYERHQRAGGQPSYNVSRLLKLAVDGFLGFSMVPLRLASILGFFIAIPSFILGAYLLVNRATGLILFGYPKTTMPGVATLGVGLFFLSGLILIILGIMGEYLGRIYLEVKRRPLYIVDYVFATTTTSTTSDSAAMIDPTTSDVGR